MKNKDKKNKKIKTHLLMAFFLSVFFIITHEHADAQMTSGTAGTTGTTNAAGVSSGVSGVPSTPLITTPTNTNPAITNPTIANPTINAVTPGDVPRDINGQRTGPYTVPSAAIPNGIVGPNTCIDLDRTRLCGVEALDWCRQNPQAGNCQQFTSGLNTNPTNSVVK